MVSSTASSRGVSRRVSSRGSVSTLPAAWRAAVERFEDLIEEGRPPDLAGCLALAHGEPAPLLVELVKTYESFRRLQGVGLPECVAELVTANPAMRAAISSAVGQLSMSAGSLDGGPLGGAGPVYVGPYLLVRELGSGGHGEVHLACSQRDAELVVIKLARSAGDRSAVEALRREKEALIRLRGVPGVPAYRDWVNAAPGVEALVMEFVAAKPLDQHIALTPPSTEQIAVWVAQLCQTLHAAHEAEVFHCDLKPQNLLIEGVGGRLCLIDFGLAHAADRWSRAPLGPARPVGSLHYLAPELLYADVEACPRLVDVFGVGAVLYYLLTGEAPFQGTVAMPARQRVEEYAIDFDRLERVTAPQPLKDLCRAALARNPLERPAHPHALRRELEKTGLLPKPRPATPIGHRSLWSWPNALIGGLLVMAGAWTVGSGGKHDAALATPSPWEEIADAQGIDLSRLTAESFSVGVAYDDANAEPWDKELSPAKKEVVLRVTAPPQLLDLVGGVRLAVGNRPEKWIDPDYDNPLMGECDLDDRDFEIGGPVRLTIGGGNRSDGGVVAGPFTYPINLSESLAAHDRSLYAKRVQEAEAAEPFEEGAMGWLLRDRYSQRYGSVIKAFEFGASPDRLDRVAARRFEPMPYWTEYATKQQITLAQSVEEAVQGKSDSERLDASTIWVRVTYLDGAQSAVRRYSRPNQFGDDGTRESAERLLAAIPAGEPMGRLRGHRFLLDRLARAAAALEAIEFLEGDGSVAFRLPVRRLAPQFGPSKAVDNAWLEEHIGRQLEMGDPAPTVEVVTAGVMMAPVSVPAFWKRAAFRGVYADGGRTPIYVAVNESPRVGLQAQAVSTQPGRRLYAMFEPPSLQSHMSPDWWQHYPHRVELLLAGAASRDQLDYAAIDDAGKRRSIWGDCDDGLPGHLEVVEGMRFATGDTSPARSEFEVSEADYNQALRDTYRPLVAEATAKLLRLVQFLPTREGNERVSGQHFSEKLLLYREARSVVAPTPESSGVGLVGIPNAAFWMCVQEVAYRVPGETGWRTLPVAWRGWKEVRGGGSPVRLPPVFTQPLPATVSRLEVAFRLDDGSVTAPTLLVADLER
jgi:serine/threonine protein kinase